MLSREQADKVLSAARLEDGLQRRLERILQLPDHLKKLSLEVLNINQSGQHVYRGWESDAKTMQAINNLPKGELERMITALMPKLAQQFLAVHQANQGNGGEERLDRGSLHQISGLDSTYEQSLVWYATHSSYLNYGQDPLTPLFVEAINSGSGEGQEILETLIAAGKGEHPIAAMGNHVPMVLLQANRPEGWEFVEKLLLAAQRQEGLRQSILDSLDEAHPEAFKRLLRLVVDHDLSRFSSTQYVLNGYIPWAFQESKDGENLTPKQYAQAFTVLLEWLENPQRCEEVATATDKSPSALELYLALWCIGRLQGNQKVMRLTMPWLEHGSIELRYTALVFLNDLGGTYAAQAMQKALHDPQPAIVAFALNNLNQVPGGFFEYLEELLTRYPKKLNPERPVPWLGYVYDLTPQFITQRMVQHMDQKAPEKMLAHWDNMESWSRNQILQKLAKTEWDGRLRELFLESVGGSDSSLRDTAFNAIVQKKLALETSEVEDLERLLSRKTADLRQGVIKLILGQGDEVAQFSAERLKAAKNAEKKAAGEEIQRQLEDKAKQGSLPKLENGLGLFNPADLTKPQPLKQHKVQLTSNAALKNLESLHALIAQHAQDPIKYKGYDDQEHEVPLVQRSIEAYHRELSLEENRKNLPLIEVWEEWYAKRPKELEDKDGFELVRALALLTVREPVNPSYYWIRETRPAQATDLLKALYGDIQGLEYTYFNLLKQLLGWLIYLHPAQGQTQFILQAADHTANRAFEVAGKLREALNALPHKESDQEQRLDLSGVAQAGLSDWLHQLGNQVGGVLAEMVGSFFTNLPEPDEDDDDDDLDEDAATDKAADTPEAKRLKAWANETRQYTDTWFSDQRVMFWFNQACGLHQQSLSPEERMELYWLERNVYQQADWVAGPRPSLELTLEAFHTGQASEADLMEQLVSLHASAYGFSSLQRLTTRKPDKLLQEHPKLAELVERVRARIVEIEAGRGDLPTAASKAAMSVKSASGAKTLLMLLQGLGRESFTRGYVWRGDDRKPAVLSHLIRATFPAESDTPELFAQSVKEAAIPEQRLIELGLYAPQWSRYVEAALDWKGLAEAMWWMHAHTKDNGWTVDAEIRESWSAEVSEQTPLTGEDLLEGAVDVNWFKKVYAELGKERWAKVYESAKFAASGTGHGRAKMFADAMLGELEEVAVVERINAKRNQDSVRALGLIPLGKKADVSTLNRYEVMQKFLKGSKQFGSQRQASEALAVRIGMQNLARTAGYPDPLRLTWAMEAKAVADLAQGPVTIERADTVFTLNINGLGEIEFFVEKKGKLLSDVPSKYKKDPEVQAMRSRKKELEAQLSRMRLSLEQSMVRGDWFSGNELRQLWDHPLLRRMLENLIFVCDAGMGYASNEGNNLRDHKGQEIALKADDALRIAHPHDLLESKHWTEWQRECLENQHKQPFKQIFRELYLLTQEERKDKTVSRRYAGHQVNPRQAMALIGSRGWVSRYEEGISKTFHDEGITAWLESSLGWTTPAEMESPTIQHVYFTKKGEWKPLELPAIPPRLFSEVMRDVDLVVSVAHVGGVDPEASQSTVEMRATLVRETARLLKLKNVTIKDSLVQIEGKLNRYTVHMGSGIVHQQPGGYLCIVAVPSQHRGRIFLPFADNDPRTAEVVSKVLLLAQDEQIKDPTILQQIV